MTTYNVVFWATTSWHFVYEYQHFGPTPNSSLCPAGGCSNFPRNVGRQLSEDTMC